jgi:hypothetical protein
MGVLMKLLSVKRLSVLLAGAVLLCHGVFGACTWCVIHWSGASAAPSIQQSTRPRLVQVTPRSTP